MSKKRVLESSNDAKGGKRSRLKWPLEIVGDYESTLVDHLNDSEEISDIKFGHRFLYKTPGKIYAELSARKIILVESPDRPEFEFFIERSKDLKIDLNVVDYIKIDKIAETDTQSVYRVFFYRVFHDEDECDPFSDDRTPLITEIDKDILSDRASQCRQLYPCDGDYYIAKLPEDFHHTSYTWDPECHKIRDVECKEFTEKLKPKAEKFITFHKYAYHGFFKPSVAEVIYQLPESLFADGHKILIRTEPYSHEINKVVADSYHHIGITYVYPDID